MRDSPGSYRIVDELPGAAKQPRALPWHPGGLFVLLIIAGAFAGPFGPLFALFFAFNWPRLGQPQRRWLTGALAIGLLVLPIALASAGMREKDTARTVMIFARFCFAYYFDLQQRPFFAQHTARGGKSASLWPLWGLAAALVGFMWWVEAQAK